MSLIDLDELTLRCRSDEAKAYVSEAVTCYKAGAFKSCVVATWIAVVYDLLSKIRELSLGGDKEAQVITNEVASLQPRVQKRDPVAIKRILEIENGIVETANEKFGFFDGQQTIDLNRILYDRNRCAHPTYQEAERPYIPSAELARAHLTHAVNHVLAAAPVQGKAATDHIVRLVESKLFPTDLEQAKLQLKLGGLDRPRDSLVRSVIDNLIYALFERPPLKSQKRTAIAIRSVYELFPGLSEPRIEKAINSLGRKMNDEDLVLLFGLQANLPQTWGLLAPDNRGRLAELLKQAKDARAVILLRTALEIPELDAACRDRITALPTKELGTLLQSKKHPLAIQRAVDIYCASNSYDDANSNYTAVIEPIIDELDEAQTVRILEAPRKEGADLKGAYSFATFIKHVLRGGKIDREAAEKVLTEQGLTAFITKHLSGEDDDDIPF